MSKFNKEIFFLSLFLFFLFFSFYPIIYELANSSKLADHNREFILEHNYYWPDFNLYLSKIKQGLDGRFTALEKYTSEPHKGSLIQIFYVYLGQLGRIFALNANFSYQLGRVILAPLLLLIIMRFCLYYFKNIRWQLIAFVIILVSGSFPKFITDQSGHLQIARYMEWWSNIDALQRITFIPHILFGQVVSFYLLYQLTAYREQPTTRKLILLIFLGNLVGLVFPPSLITLNGVIFTQFLMKLLILAKNQTRKIFYFLYKYFLSDILFLILTFPSLLYFLIITRFLPWSSLVDFHRTHPMMIPFGDYILGTGPVFFLGLAGAVVLIIKREKKYQPLIFWILVTFLFAILFTHLKEQSPLRFTQTGLFIPLGILTAYLFYWLFHLSDLSHLRKLTKLTVLCLMILYLLTSLFMMKNSLDWQLSFIKARIGANIPLVPYPPQTMYPLKNWMEGIRWLGRNTNRDEAVLAEITAGNFIPAYSGNTVYFGQSNTVDYERKQLEVWRFFEGKMTPDEAKIFLAKGRINYIFFSVQEKERSKNNNLETLYPFLKSVYTNPIVTIYSSLK